VIAEWDVPFDLITPAGTLHLNVTDGTTGFRYQLVPERCSASLAVRVTEDDMPQHDGKIPHRRWRSGYQMHLAIEPMIEVAGEFDCAGGGDLVTMMDLLGLHLNAMIRTGLFPGAPNARLTWDPTDFDARMLDRAQLLGAPVVSLDGALGGMLIEFDIDTPYPYYISTLETDTALSDSGVHLIHNAGNTDFYPVIQVNGPIDNFIITNESIVDLNGDPLVIEYDSTLPGAVGIDSGHYVEIIPFQATVFLDGDGANRKAGINMLTTDWFPLIPGDNEIWISNGTGVIKANDAWA
jgi:hypothetical protein